MISNAEHIFNDFVNIRLLDDIFASDMTVRIVEGFARQIMEEWTSGDEIYLTFVDSAAKREIVKVTDISGDTLTVTRGQDGTAARAWYAGTLINQRVPNVNLERIMQKHIPRTVTEFPHGSLVPNYPGEKILYDDRWWKASGTIGGADETNWRLIAGTIDPDTEEYDEDGYVVKKIPKIPYTTYWDIADDGWPPRGFYLQGGGLWVWARQSTKGHVLKFDGTNWVDQGNPNLYSSPGRSITDLNGRIFAASAGDVHAFNSQDDWETLNLRALTVMDITSHNGKIYSCQSLWFDPYSPTQWVARYDGDYIAPHSGGEWTNLEFPLLEGEQPTAVISYQGSLYAAGNKKVYRFVGVGNWTYIGTPSSTVFRFLERDNKLLAISRGVWQHDGGTTWSRVGDDMGTFFGYGAAVNDGNLYVCGRGGAGPLNVLNEVTNRWENISLASLGITTVTDIASFNSKIYFTTNGGETGANSARIYEYIP